MRNARVVVLNTLTEAPPSVFLMGMRLHAITEQRCKQWVMSALSDNRGGVIVTANLDHLRRYGTDPTYRRVAQDAELVVADGAPLIWASHVQGTPLPERIAGSNLIFSLSETAAKHGRSIFLLGGNEGTDKEAAEKLKALYPGLKVAGTTCPPIGFDKNEAQLNDVIGTLKQKQPDIVYVALGSPKQELFIDRIKRELPNAWWVGVGISFSFVTGDVKRAPEWMQNTGLEWVHRLSQEPKRLAKRYLVQGIPFGLRLMGSALVNRKNK